MKADDIFDLVQSLGWRIEKEEEYLIATLGDDSLIVKTVMDKRKYYVFVDNGPWFRVGLQVFLYAAFHKTLEDAPGSLHKIKGTGCTCGKRSFPTQKRADEELRRTKIDYAEKNKLNAPVRSYRCTDDVRRWHHTKKRTMWRKNGTVAQV